MRQPTTMMIPNFRMKTSTAQFGCALYLMRLARWLAHYSGVSKRIPSGLGPDGETVRLGSHGDRLHSTARSVDGINNLLEPSGEPEEFAVLADVAHIRTAAAGDLPRLFHFVRAAVGDVQFLAVAARIEAVSAAAGPNEVNLLEIFSVDQEYAVGFHIGNEEQLSVGGNANVLRHAMRRRCVLPGAVATELEVTEHLVLHRIDLGDSAS